MKAAAAVLLLAAPALAQTDRAERLSERARQDREIVYFLQPPETHAFDLYHDYTESRPGVSRYLNVVRPGSTASSPSAHNLDTGEALRVETLRGNAVPKSGTGDDEEIAPDEDASVQITVPQDGAVRFYCRFHSGQGMQGAIFTAAGQSVTG